MGGSCLWYDTRRIGTKRLFFHLGLLEIAFDGRTWCGMCPLSVAAEAYVRTSQRTRKLSKCFHPTCFSFRHTISTQHTFLPVHNFSQVFPSTKLSSINYYSHLHLSGFTPLRKIPTVNHYLRNRDFQQGCLRFPRVIIDDYLLSQRFLNTSVSAG